MAINKKNSQRKEELNEKMFADQIAYNENIVFSIAAAKKNEIFLKLKRGSYMPLGMDSKKDIDAETRFDVGSVTKTVTSALAVKLAEEKKLDA